LTGADIEEVAFEDLGAERAQLVGTFVDLVDEGANRNSRLSSISDTCRPVLPCLPPAAEVTRTGFAMAVAPLHACLVWVPCGTIALNLRYKRYQVRGDDGDEIDVGCAPGSRRRNPGRERILDAAFSAFMEGGFAETSTLEIATRARVLKARSSTRWWQQTGYAVACIRRARNGAGAADLPEPHDAETLSRVLTAFGTQLLREVSDPPWSRYFQLAIAEGGARAEVAADAERHRRRGRSRRLREIMTRAQSAGLLNGKACRDG